MRDVAEVITITPPNVEEGIREALAAQRRKVDEWTAQQVKSIEQIGDGRLKRLDQAVAALNGGFRDDASSKSVRRRKGQGGRSKTGKRAEIEARRQAVYKYLLEHGTPKPCSEISRSLNLSHSKTLRTLSRLIEDKMVLRTGENADTRYQVKSGVPARAEPRQGSSATTVEPLDYRLLRSIERHGSVTPDELAREFRLPFEHVQRGCAALVRQNLISPSVREGRQGYTLLKAAA